MVKDYEPYDNEIYDIAKTSYIKSINRCSFVGEYIVNKYIDKTKSDEFISIWKENFIQNMQPNFLPKSFIKIK